MSPPLDFEAVEAVEGLISPLRIPPELRELWTRVQVASLPIGVRRADERSSPLDPLFCDPAISYAVWSNMLEHPEILPLTLLPIAVSVALTGEPSRLIFASLDLPDAASPGGVHEWTIGEDRIVPRSRTLEAWLEALTEATRATEPVLLGDHRWWTIHERDLDSVPVPDAEAGAPWPPAWRRASALFDGRRSARITTSIARLRWAQPLEANIVGETHEIAGNEQGMRLQVIDGSGVLDAWCPSDVGGAWMLRHFGRNELAVTTDVSSWTPSESRSLFWNDVLRTPPDAVVRGVRCRVVA